MYTPSLTDVQFEATSWREQTQDMPNCRVWHDDQGDLAILTCYALPPDIPAALNDLEAIWRVTRIAAFENQAAPISLKVGVIDGVPTLETITKFYSHNGDLYQASVIIPFRDLSYVLCVQCSPAPELDEARSALAREAGAGASANWYRDPFNFPIVSPIGFDLSDEDRWDSAVPDHALSRLRRHVALLSRAAKLCDAAKAQPRFDEPSVARNFAREEAFLEVFAIGPGEREEAATYGAALTQRIEAILARCSTPKDTATLLDNNKDAASKLAAEVRALLNPEDDEKFCLLLYSGATDSTMLSSMRLMSQFYAQRDSDPSEIEQPDEMASQNFRHWEFVCSRQMRLMNFRSVAIRRDDFAFQDFAISLVKADENDWLAKMIVLAEMADVIFSASFFNANLSRELSHAFATPHLQRKLVYRSSRRKFMLGDRQDVPWPESRLVELLMFVSLRKRGFPVSFATDHDDAT